MNINENFIINLQGKSYVTYEGLLDSAHKMGLKSLEVEIIQIPNPENNMTAICVATACTEDAVYTDIGDASPKSVNNMLIPHIIRMASTRAKARALRDLTNVGMTAIEEISIDENSGANLGYDEAPTERQITTLKKLMETGNSDIDFDTLNKKTAGSLISKLIEEQNMRK